jgi:hypothetical protein
MNTNPAAIERNLHHTLEYRNQADWDSENLSKGDGDPDIYGYPGEPTPEANPDEPYNPVPF